MKEYTPELKQSALAKYYGLRDFTEEELEYLNTILMVKI